MSTRQTSIDEDDFQAFVDGQLPPERCRAVMTYLASQPEESARMSDYRSLSEDLHATYDEVLYEPLPARLRIEHYRGRSSWRERLQRWTSFGAYGMTPRLAGIALLLVASAGGGWWLHSAHQQQIRSNAVAELETPGMVFARQAANAHRFYAPDAHNPSEFGADQEEAMIVRLFEQFGEPLHVPQLQEAGFALVGGRLLPAGDQPAAVFLYEDTETQSQMITLFVTDRWSSPLNAAQPEGSVIHQTQNEVGLVYWIEGPFAYALMGEMDPEQLFATASTIQQQVTFPVVPPQNEQTATTEKDAT
ncbi:MAG: anti-sigma factor [Pseudomonadota bacterium]